MNEEEKIRQPKLPEFTSSMTKRELICALIWLPVHIVILPRIIGGLCAGGTVAEATANLLVYGISGIYIVAFEFSFLRRNFDPFCDNFLFCVLQIVVGYIAMMAMNMIASGTVSLFGRAFGAGAAIDNLNNDAIIDMAGEERNTVSAMAIFVAPIVEEVIFRGGIFASLRKKNRTAAYAVSMLLFAVYHVWAYAAADPWYWIYLIQYLPAGFILCRCYEKTNSIWTGIFFHMLTNGIALKALEELGKML